MKKGNTIAYEKRCREASLLNRKTILSALRPRKQYSDEFYTPDWILAGLGHFDLDPCAGPKSFARHNVRLPDDGLSLPWHGRVWLNPPYSNIHDWLDIFQQHGNGICLVNARPDSMWFQRLASKSDALLWLKGRVAFEQPDGKRGNGPVGSCLMAIGGENANALFQANLPGFVTILKTFAIWLLGIGYWL